MLMALAMSQWALLFTIAELCFLSPFKLHSTLGGTPRGVFSLLASLVDAEGLDEKHDWDAYENDDDESETDSLLRLWSSE